LRLGQRGRAFGVRKRPTQLLAGADVELEEHLAQVVLDGPRADEQLRTDLGVGMALGCETGDLRLLSGELFARLERTFTDGLAGG
jgi:hypothetical protein